MLQIVINNMEDVIVESKNAKLPTGNADLNHLSNAWNGVMCGGGESLQMPLHISTPPSPGCGPVPLGGMYFPFQYMPSDNNVCLVLARVLHIVVHEEHEKHCAAWSQQGFSAKEPSLTGSTAAWPSFEDELCWRMQAASPK